MNNQITVYSRSNNDFLFDRMKSFIPEGIEVIKCDQFQDWHQADKYLYHIIDNCPTRWAVNIDIDCYVYDWSELLKDVKFIDRHDLCVMGMPDSIDYHPQRFHSKHAMNPFFNIFNVEIIRELKEKDGFTWEEIAQTKIGRENGEPFHGFFQWLAINKTPYKMNTYVHFDGITTQGGNMLYHTWYSRHYGENSPLGDFHTPRIDHIYNCALELKNKIS